MALILDGKAVANAAKDELKARVEKLKNQGLQAGLAVVLVGDDPASRYYTNALIKLAGSLGVNTVVRELACDVNQETLLGIIDELNQDDSISGILPMMPLPAHLDPDKVASRITPEKDVDAINPLNVGLVASGKSRWAPCTPRAVMAILDYYKIELEGRRAVIIGRSNVVGKPLAHLLLGRNATVTVCHSRTKNLADVVKQGDIVIAAVGKAAMVGREMIAPDAVVIDVGINEVEGKIVGDVDFTAVEPVASAITPVPGGVGVVSNVMVIDAVLRKFAK